MSDGELEEVRDFWNRIADDWRIQVGDDGDRNRILNSDPLLWEFAGDVSGLTVLDAGCGTGYLSKKLRDRGALVTGIDFSERMIEIARATHPDIGFRVDSCSELRTIGDEHFDIVIANYVLMDVPDLGGTMKALTCYCWSFTYFEQRKCADPPWGHFKSEFIWFHRPLSDYWKAFMAAGFAVVDFEEPKITEDRYHLARNERELKNGKTRPYSVAFKLQKKPKVA